MLLGLLAPILSTPIGTVTLSGEGIGDSQSAQAAIAGIRFNADGTVDKREAGVYTQIDSATDWIIPLVKASVNYDVRVTNVTATGGLAGFNFVSAASEDTWIDLGSDREWSCRDNNSTDLGDYSFTCDFEIRIGGSTRASTQYTFTADYEAV